MLSAFLDANTPDLDSTAVSERKMSGFLSSKMGGLDGKRLHLTTSLNCIVGHIQPDAEAEYCIGETCKKNVNTV